MLGPASHKFIFLCGLHRSGTTPLFRILRQHPQVSGFENTGVPEDEGQHLQTVFPPAIAFGGPGRFGFAAEAHLTEESSLVTEQNRQILFQQWSRHWDLNKEYLLEKSPPNLTRSRFLQALFPESSFVVILRHPIAVSLATVKWSRTRLVSLLEHWVRCHRVFEADRTHLKRVTVIRYEDLIQSPTFVLERLRRFLGLNSPLTGQLDPHGNQRYFNAWRALAGQSPGGTIVRDLIGRYEEAVQAFGYSLRELESTAASESGLSLTSARTGTDAVR